LPGRAPAARVPGRTPAAGCLAGRLHRGAALSRAAGRPHGQPNILICGKMLYGWPRTTGCFAGWAAPAVPQPLTCADMPM